MLLPSSLPQFGGHRIRQRKFKRPVDTKYFEFFFVGREKANRYYGFSVKMTTTTQDIEGIIKSAYT